MSEEQVWTTLSAMFTKEELVSVKAVQKLTGWSTSKLVRQCVYLGTHVLLLQIAVNNPSLALTKFLTPIAMEIFDKRTMRRIETRLEKVKATIPPDVMKEGLDQLGIVEQSTRVYQQHRKRGRPTKKKGKRGRPADKGSGSSGKAFLE